MPTVKIEYDRLRDLELLEAEMKSLKRLIDTGIDSVTVVSKLSQILKEYI